MSCKKKPLGVKVPTVYPSGNPIPQGVRVELARNIKKVRAERSKK